MTGGRALETAGRLRAIDRRLMAAPVAVKFVIIGATIALMIWTSLPNVPREWTDLSRFPLLSRLHQQPAYGTDTLSDTYGARVVLHDPRDMYTKRELAQTPQEAATWSREASAPYPPAALFIEAALFRLGEWTGAGFYGCILALAVVFLSLSLLYCLRTRWYLFPLLYLNFGYFSERFVHVQDDTYLIMLVVSMAALWAARRGLPAAAHLLVAVASPVKLSGLYYAKHALTMKRPVAAAFIAVLLLGLVAPYFIFENYLYIYRYGNDLKGHWYDTVVALAIAVPFAIALWRLESRLGFDLEDRIGWGLVPFALFLALKMNVPRHLLVVLLVPDKRVVRNLAAAVALAAPALFPHAVHFGAAGPIAAVILAAGLAFQSRAHQP
jgi:hypothetical protein